MNLFGKKQPPADAAQPNLAAAMTSRRKASLKDALEEAGERGFSLDYSVASLKVVDQVLESMRQELLKEGLKTFDEMSGRPGVLGSAMFMAEYVAACIDKHLQPGKWVETELDFLPGYQVGEEVIFPIHWCLKRIGNGPEDSIAVKYQVLAKGLKNSSS